MVSKKKIKEKSELKRRKDVYIFKVGGVWREEGVEADDVSNGFSTESSKTSEVPGVCHEVIYMEREREMYNIYIIIQSQG